VTVHSFFAGGAFLKKPAAGGGAYSTTGSISFGNRAGYLSVANFGDVIGTGDFTIEMFVYLTAGVNGAYTYMFDHDSTSNPQMSFFLGDGQNSMTGASTYNTGYHGTTGFTPSTSTWYHVAWSRSSGVSNVYQAGTRTVSYQDATNYAKGSTTAATLGAPWTSDGTSLTAYPSYVLAGSMSNIRVSNVSRYSGASFTVPTSGLTVDANTLLM